jgi:hydroxysqualene dehydroxylase
MKERHVVIIGGGLAGLSAAVELTSVGIPVVLFELRQQLGGRTYSFFEPKTTSTVDNGQHLLMGCYSATRKYLKLVNAEQYFSLQSSLEIPFLSSGGANSVLHCPNAPAPLHVALGLLSFHVLPLKDRFKLFTVAQEILTTSPEKEKTLDRLTVDEWLSQLRQPEACRKYLWDVITIGALNNHPTNVSALMFFRILRAAFLGKKENASLMIPRIGLSDALIQPAQKFIQERGGQIHTGVGVRNIRLEGNMVRSVRTTAGDELEAPCIISAVPWYALPQMLPQISCTLQASPIIAIHCWFDRQVTNLDFSALIDTRIQWLFNKGSHKDENGQTIQHLSFVISGAQDSVEMTKEELLRITLDDVCQLLPDSKNAQLLHSVVIKEKRATFTPSPGLETIRPTAQTEYDNLFLAGDWTATGYPATIEGAVLSGQTAAALAAKRFR